MGAPVMSVVGLCMMWLVKRTPGKERGRQEAG
jgi:hypothetical protein